jgi:hypothetical protein
MKATVTIEMDYSPVGDVDAVFLKHQIEDSLYRIQTNKVFNYANFVMCMVNRNIEIVEDAPEEENENDDAD